MNVSDIRAEYREVPPPPALRPFVECLWLRSAREKDSRHDRRILPDGRMDLVWMPGEGVLVAGPQTRFTERPGRFPLIAAGIRFHPGVAPSLLHLPASELIDGHVALAAIDERLAAQIDGRLEDALDGDVLHVLAGEVLRRADDLASVDPEVREAVHLLSADSPRATDVASAVFLSERQLRRRFAERVGYGPKTLHRILRFQRLTAALRAGSELAAAAATAGYADQAHMSRECKRLAGVTPSELAAWLGST